MNRLAVVLAALLLLLAGCGSLADAMPVDVARTTVVPIAPVAEPTAVRIPAIGVSSTLTQTGLLPDGTAETPPVTQPQQASWSNFSGRPGEAGYPAVILGHVSGRPPGATRSVPGVFARLDELAPGDEVLVDRADGTSTRFVVGRVELHPKDLFPTDAVYGDTATPTLRLITCGGDFDPAAHSYRSNVVVFAELS